MTDVFISYASEDRARAKRLAEALEARGLSVWWDRKILTGEDYAKVIDAELRKAKSAVVLWSKGSVVSGWVRDEADVHGKRGTLVPALIDTVDPPLGFRWAQTVDLVGWEGEPDHLELDALCRGISRHLGRALPPPPAPPPTVHSQTKPRRRVLLFFRAGVALLILAGSALWYWDAFHHQHIDYYANVIKRWGLPEGVGPLTDEEVRHRNVSLAFHKRGRWGKVQDIRAVNSRGRYPAAFAYTPLSSFVGLNPLANEFSEIATICRVTFAHDADGRVVAQMGYNRSDRPLYVLHYAQPDFAEYKEGAFTAPKEPSGITHIKFIRPDAGPEAGLDKELRYFDRERQPQPDRNGIYGYRLTFNALGQAVEWINLGADGQPAVSRHRTARGTATYDDQGNVTREATFGVQGQPVLSASGSAETTFRYDPYGNLTEFASFGAEGQLVTSKNRGAAGQRSAFDDRGNVVENAFFGPDRRPVIGSLGFAKQTIVWDERGGSLESYFGPDGKPIPILGRVIKIRGLWDERGYLVETAFLDENNRSVRNNRGCAKQRLAYDDQGNVAESACLDEGDQAIRDTDGAARVKSVYDERGNQIEASYFGPDGRPGRYEENYAKARWKYDSQGKRVEEAYFDAEGKPVKKRDGYAKVTYGYDLQGNMIEVAYLDDNGQPTESKRGYARIARAYDVRGNMIDEQVFDIRGKPVRSSAGFFKAKMAYDDRGYRVEYAYYDEQDRPVIHEDGYAKVRKKYSDQGRLIEESFFGLDGSPMIREKYGYAKRRWTYGANGKESRLAYYDANDHLVLHSFGYATARYSYDELGRETKREFYDVGGAPVLTRVTINKVEPDGKAKRAGLQEGDAVLDYDGEEVADTHVFSELELVKGERPRALTVQRDGGILSLDVSPGRLTGLETADKVPARLAKASGRIRKVRP